MQHAPWPARRPPALLLLLALALALILLLYRLPARMWPPAPASALAASASRVRGQTRAAHLVMVPGHAIFTGANPMDSADWSMDAWLAPLLPHIINHIKVGLDTARQTGGLAVFSGGMTRQSAGQVSEAASYIRAATTLGWLRASNDVASEDFARDSFENLLFSICVFKSRTGTYPEKITIVGFSFKDKRYVKNHAKAIRFPSVAVLPLGEELRAKHGALEESGPIPQFNADPYGCQPPLSDKRESRNPFKRQHDYANMCPEMADLLKWCGPAPFTGPLPWSPSR